MKKSKIVLTVSLDNKNLPQKIEWEAEDNPNGGKQEVKSMFISLFEKETLDTLKIDLWTKEMQVNEMDTFMYQTFRALTDTYKRATNNVELANEMMRFVQYFGEKTEVIPPVE